MKTKAVERHYLRYQDRARNSNKFYEVFITDHGVMLSYGRMGTAGQQKWLPADSWSDASTLAKKRLFEKLANGYEQDASPEVYQVAAEPWGDNTMNHPTISRLRSPSGGRSNVSPLKQDAPLKEMSGDLATQAEAFADKVAAVITDVKRGGDAPVLLAIISELDVSLERAELAIESAQLGLQMARTALGRRMQTEV